MKDMDIIGSKSLIIPIVYYMREEEEEEIVSSANFKFNPVEVCECTNPD